MIKSLIIVGLVFVLALGLFITRPSAQSFQDFYVRQATSKDSGFLSQTLDSTVAKAFASTFTYEDHYLWVNETMNGKVAYTGLFSHWFSRDLSVAKPAGAS